MPHQTTDIDDTHEGDSRDIELTVYEQSVGGRRQNLRDARVEWLVKADPTDSDSEALLVKDSQNDGEIEITDERNGIATIHVREGDTDGFLTVTDDDGTTQHLDERTVHHAARVWDTRGNRVTVCHGEWTLYTA